MPTLPNWSTGQTSPQCDAVPVGDRSLRALWTQQVPAIACDISEYGNYPIGLMAWLGQKLDPSGAHPVIRGLEVVDSQEHSHASGELITGGSVLPLAVGFGK